MPMIASIASAASKALGFIGYTVFAYLKETYFSYVSLLVKANWNSVLAPNPLSGVNSPSTTPFISDAGLNNALQLATADARNDIFNPYMGGYYSIYFNTGDKLTFPSSSQFDFSGGSWTIECWFYSLTQPASGNATRLFMFGVNGSSPAWGYGFGPTNQINSGPAYSGTGLATATNIYSLNTWNHVAWSVNSGNMSIYVNGVLSAGPTAISVPVSGATTLIIGYDTASTVSFQYNGYLSNVRITKGVGLYTSNFTPSATPLTTSVGTGTISVFTANSNRFIDTSSNAFAITLTGSPAIAQNVPFTVPSTYSTYGSGYFTGSSSTYISGTISALNFGSQQLSVEMWIYPTNITVNNQSLFTAGSGNLSILMVSLNGTIQPGQYGTASISNSTGTCTPLAWNHVVVTRDGSNNWRTFINGVLQGYGSKTFTPNNSSYLIGYGTVSTVAFYGYISDLHVVVNNIPTAYNTSATTVPTTVFIPPTSPNTQTPYSQLLTLQYNGASTNTSALDSGPYNFPIGRSGRALTGSFSPYSENGWSTLFNGTTDYLSVSNTNTMNFATTGVNFTIEVWVFPYTTSATLSAIIAMWTQGGAGAGDQWLIYVASNVLYFDWQPFSESLPWLSGGSVPNYTWTHIAVTRSGTTFTVWINGVSIASGTNSGTTTGSGYAVTIGYYGSGIGGSATSYWNGYISNVRIVTGTALYSSTFTPSTTPLTPIAGTILLTCQDNRFIDNSSTVGYAITATGTPRIKAYNPFGSHTFLPATNTQSFSYITGGSNWFTVASSGTSAFNFGTNNFTIECWVYTTVFGNGNAVIVIWDGGGSTARFTLGLTASGVGSDTSNGLSFSYTNPNTVTLSLNTWAHVAITRSGNNWYWYTNGVCNQTATNSASFTPSSVNMTIGNYSSSYSTGTQYVSNVRVVNGTALYSGTASFTPPTTALSLVPNTALLWNTAALTDQSTNKLAITVGSGTPTLSRANPFLLSYTSSLAATGVPYSVAIASGSMFFDSASYYNVNSTTAITFGTGNFTIEFWMYNLSSTTTTRMMGNTVPVGTWTTNGWVIAPSYNQSGSNYFIGMSVYNYSSSAFLAVSSINIPLYTWAHVAFVRNGTTLTSFVNGVLAGTTTSFSVSMDGGTLPFRVVGFSGISTDTAFNGYLTDVRVTVGTALYSNGFYPSAAPLTNATTGAAVLLTGSSAGVIDSSTKTDLIPVNGTGTNVYPQVVPNIKNNSTGSIYFSGTSPQALKLSDQSVGDFNAGNFTVELWVYFLTVSAGYQPLIHYTNGSADKNGWALYIETNNTIAFAASAASNTWSVALNTSGVVPNINAWNHVAIVRNGSTWTLYLNGNSVQTTSSSVSITTQTGGMYIGYYPYFTGGARSFNGYMDEIRITMGIARYTSNFTTPGAMTTQ